MLWLCFDPDLFVRREILLIGVIAYTRCLLEMLVFLCLCFPSAAISVWQHVQLSEQIRP